MAANRRPNASVESYKRKLVEMSLEEVQEKAKAGNLRAKQELFRRTGISNVITKEMRRDAFHQRLSEKGSSNSNGQG